MNYEFKKGNMVYVCGYGEENRTFYKNEKGVIVERDPYYKDYLVRFKNGKEDWFSAENIRKPYSRKTRKRRAKNEDKLYKNKWI